MDAKELFLDQHAVVHSAAVGGNKASAAERALGGVSDDQMRVRPREDLNSIAWILWHIARAEDIILNPVLAGRAQVLDDAWVKRLGITRRDFGIGMSSAEVWDLTRQDRRGRRARVPRRGGPPHPRDRRGLPAGGLAGAERGRGHGARRRGGGVRRAGRADRQGVHGPAARLLLSGIALFHPAGHLGEATTVRSAGGFGVGI